MRPADSMNHRKVLREQVFAADRRDVGTVPYGEKARRLFEFVRPEIGGRRVDQIAGELDRFDAADHAVPIHTFRHHETAHACAIAAPVSHKLVSPEPPGDRCEFSGFGSTREMVGALRKASGE